MAATGDPQLGRRIRDARLRAKMTQQEVVDQMPSAPIGRDYHWLSNIERGFRSISPRQLGEIAAILEVTVDELVYGQRTTAPVALTSEEQVLIQAWRAASAPVKRMMLASAQAVIEDGSDEDQRGGLADGRLPRPG